MSVLSSRYGSDSESYGFFGGLRRAIFGKNTGKFRSERNWNPVNAKQILVDTSFNELINVAQNVPHLNVVISRGAEMFSNMRIKHVGKDEKEIENSPIVKLLHKPNPLQGRSDFLYDYYVNKAIYGAAFAFKNKGPLGIIPKCVWWLPSGLMQVKTTGKLYKQIDISGIVEAYILSIGDEDELNQRFDPKEIIHITDGVSQNKLAGSSKIESLQIPLSNIVAALKSLNIITTERGLIGFISSERSDSTGLSIPMTPKERTEFQNQYQKDYDLNSRNGHVMITEASLKWVPMTFDVKQLMLLEGLEDAFAQICGAYGLDRDIFPSIKGATFENKKQGLISTIQNTMLPQGEVLCEVLSDHFGLIDKGEKLMPSWDHLPVMQEDALSKAQARKANVEACHILLDDGQIDPEQYAKLTDTEFTGTGITANDKAMEAAKEANKQNNKKDGKTKGA